MNIYFVFLGAGILVLIFGILTFNGKTALSKRSHFIFGIELDKSVIGIVIFFLGMVLISVFLIGVIGPHFNKEGI
ncbi:MAG: hypothetical protein H0V61_01020 [Chitinophagales bacterium]|jgi:hypothetical protein|nr:hypothetical protein [Chitinophagales bacterium]